MSAVLCYVEGPWAYFTTRDLDKQWGDDWNDAPYEHNAGEPYEPYRDDQEHWEIHKIAFEGPYETPAEKYSSYSPYSVEAINNKEIAWLSAEHYTINWPNGRPEPIFAGDTMEEFIQKMQAAGGKVYTLLKEEL
jgi:hypothetical protein